MLQAKLLAPDEYETAVKSPLRLRQDNSGRFDFSALTAANGRPCYQHALEQVLLRLFGDQAVYRGGWTIQTTIDKRLQEDLSRLEERAPDKEAGHTPEQVTIVRQDGLIRALVCSAGREPAIGEKPASPESQTGDYEMSVVSPEAITQEQIILSVDGGKR